MCHLLTSVAEAFGFGELKKLYPCGVIYPCSWALYMFEIMKSLNLFSSEIAGPFLNQISCGIFY